MQIEPTTDQDYRANKRRFLQMWNELSPSRKRAALYILSDLKIAVGGSREITEIGVSYRNSLTADDASRKQAIGHISRLLDITSKNLSLWNVGVVEIEQRGKEKRAALSTLGIEVLASMESRLETKRAAKTKSAPPTD